MLRVLTLSTLFPDASRPSFGVFVEQQTLALAGHPEVEVEVRVVAPRGLPPWPLSRHPHYRALDNLPERETWRGLTVYRPRFALPPVLPRLRPALLARALLPLLREIRRDFAFDVIDAEFFYPDGPAAARLARALGVPFSIKARGADIHYWGSQPGCARQIVVAGKAAGGLLAVSAVLARDMAAIGLPADRIRVHYTGVDLDRFHPVDRAAAKATLGVAGPLLVTAGHLIPRKGQAFVVEAMAGLPDVTLLIVGDGPDRNALEAQIAATGLADRVRLLGAQPHHALPALLAAADVVVQPSSSEGLANVWVEALASGTPVVTTDVGGAREIIDHPAAGRLVPREAGAIAAAVRAILADPPAPEAVRARAARFTWEANRDALFDHLTGIAGRSVLLRKQEPSR